MRLIILLNLHKLLLPASKIACPNIETKVAKVSLTVVSGRRLDLGGGFGGFDGLGGLSVGCGGLLGLLVRLRDHTRSAESEVKQ